MYFSICIIHGYLVLSRGSRGVMEGREPIPDVKYNHLFYNRRPINIASLTIVVCGIFSFRSGIVAIAPACVLCMYVVCLYVVCRQRQCIHCMGPATVHCEKWGVYVHLYDMRQLRVLNPRTKQPIYSYRKLLRIKQVLISSTPTFRRWTVAGPIRCS